MNGIKVLEQEHENILEFTHVLRAMAAEAMKNNRVVPEDFTKAIEFVRRYSDRQHHGKEEKILFRFMKEKLGIQAQILIENGMMVEHDMARLYISQLEECIQALMDGKMLSDDIRLDVVGHSMEYANLLQRHAEKENLVVFPFAERELSHEDLKTVDDETIIFEDENRENREEMLAILAELKDKYM